MWSYVRRLQRRGPYSKSASISRLKLLLTVAAPSWPDSAPHPSAEQVIDDLPDYPASQPALPAISDTTHTPRQLKVCISVESSIDADPGPCLEPPGVDALMTEPQAEFTPAEHRRRIKDNRYGEPQPSARTRSRCKRPASALVTVSKRSAAARAGAPALVARSYADLVRGVADMGMTPAAPPRDELSLSPNAVQTQTPTARVKRSSA